MKKSGFTLLEFLIGMTMTSFIFIVATNLVVTFMTVDSKSQRSQAIEQAKSDITAELTGVMQWASNVNFDDQKLIVDNNTYKVENGVFYKNDNALTGNTVLVNSFEVKRFVASSASTTAQTGTGLIASYFDNKDLSELKVNQLDPSVNFNWGLSGPAPTIGNDTFSARWAGQLEVPRSGTFTFYTRANDGVKLWVNNTLIIDNWNGVQDGAGNISLSSSKLIPIQVEYYDNFGEANVSLEWSGPGLARSIIPTESLYPLGAQTSYQITMNFTNKAASDFHDALSLFISPRIQSSQSVVTQNP